MEELNQIKVVILDKYRDTTLYNEVVQGIYKNIRKDNYCMSFEAEIIEQYPLETLLSQYSLNCTNDYCGEEAYINGEKKWIAEVETDGDLEHLIKLLNFSTIIDKKIVEFSLDGYGIIGVNYGTTNFIINDKEIKVPIIGCRHDPWGQATFTLKYPEAHLQSLFLKGQHHHIPDFTENAVFKGLLLKGYHAYLVFTENDEYKGIMYNQKEPIRIEKGSLLISSIRGYK